MAPRGLEARREQRQGPVIESQEQEEIAESVVGDVFALADHELPPELRPERPLFNEAELLAAGMRPEEILRLKQQGHRLEGFDNREELDRLEKLQRQNLTVQQVDAGAAATHGAMRAYFEGREPLRDAKGEVVRDERGREIRCQRYRYVSGEDITVVINAYPFQIRKHTPAMLPSEVIAILEDRARALQQYDVLANIYGARLAQPVGGMLDASTIAIPADGGLQRFLAGA